MPNRAPDESEASALKRRLAAVAFVDVVGYTILMASDETRTHMDWMAVLEEVIRPELKRHGGTLVKSTGDGVLAEFSSALNAVSWARVIQRRLRGDHSQSGRVSSIVLRISVNIGDIIATEFDIFGDCVNVAARLQEHAPPGGIALSESVHESVRGSLESNVRDLGFVELRNLSKRLRAYAIDPGDSVAVPVRPKAGKLPSIAVLPLQNLSGDSSDDYFCDGCVEDISSSLASLRELTVISHGSMHTYRRRDADPREIGQLLGARYVLRGNMRRADQHVRLSVELCDAHSGETLWSERAQLQSNELFNVQERIVERIVAGIAPNVRDAHLKEAMRKKPESFTAYDLTLRGLYAMHSLHPSTFSQAREFFNRAMMEDPNFALPVSWAARWHSLYVGQGWSEDPESDRAKAVELAIKAIELDGQNALALATYGYLRSFLFHDYDSALTYFDRAFSACPNHAVAWMLSVATLSYIGRADEAIEHGAHALRLSPMDRTLFTFYGALALAHYAKGNYEEAVKWGRMSENENPYYTSNLRYLAAALAALGREVEARQGAAKLMARHPEFRLSTYGRSLMPFRSQELRERYIKHLGMAGLPD